MLSQTKSKKKSGFLTSFLSYYIIILCIPLLVGIGLNFYSNQVIQDEVIKANKVVIKQLQLSIDQRIHNIREFTMQLETDESLYGIIHTKNELSTLNRYTLKHVISNFSAYNLSNGFIEDFFVYCYLNKTIIGPYGYTNTTGMRDKAFYDVAWYFPKWYTIIHQEHRSELYPIFLENTHKLESIVYLQSLPSSIYSEPNAIAVIKLNNEYFDELMASTLEISEGNATFAIIDKNNHILYAYGDEGILNAIEAYDLGTMEDGFLSIHDKRDYYAYMAASNNSHWRYLTITPTSVFNKRVKGVQMIAFFSLVLILILSILAIVYVKRRRYDPLASTIDLLRSDNQTPHHDDAFKFLQEKVEQTLNDKSSMEETMLMNRDYLRNYFLIRMLNQPIDDEGSFMKIMDYYGIDLLRDYTNVVIFYLNSYDDQSLQENTAFLGFLEDIKNTFYAVFKEESSNAALYPVYLNNMVVCMINYTKKIHHDHGIVRWLNGFKEEMNKADVSVAMSQPKTTLHELNDAYDEALQALEHQLVYGKSGVGQYKSVMGYRKKITHIKYYQYENNFIMLLDSGEFQKAKNVINNLFSLVLNQETMPMNSVKCRMFGIINILMNTVEKYNLDAQLIALDELYDKLIGFYSIEDLRTGIIKTLDTIKEHVKSDHKHGDGNMIKMVKHHIHQHYMDTNLSVSQLACKFKVDMSILSKKFKKDCGINLSDYIHLERLKIAKPMIIETNDTIKTIAIKCGYLNSDVFIRVFKRYEGITPGKFRQNSK
ncbi:AraC family transcriptional regulator [Vallitalea pronyensis]|uniref:AraC family transcriptional regulator n=1 Tax=Vallitalea pronyensis TaxID=1348613 RepID=A0A8J8MIU2_9FIRM|nr:helix-turn-helix domain-containing protein [Vallitalea pronyensis]QUI22246.1 AraC family transcriptional regulator [Vallitalea pronyensis]